MKRSWLATAFVLVLSVAGSFAVGACGKSALPEAPNEAAGPSNAVGATPAASTASAERPGAPPDISPGAEHTGRQRKPFPVHSSCSEVVTVVFGDEPKAAGAGRRTVAPNSAIDAPRDAEGKQTVWLLDDEGEPLVRVHVTRGMKQLEVGRSCRTLEAH